MFRDYILPVAVYSGGMIGVGFLALPYIATQVGIWLMLAYFVLVTFIIVVLTSVFCKISLKTPDFKRIPGFAEYYLGKWGKIVALSSMFFTGIGVLLVYLLVGSNFLFNAFSPFFSGKILSYALIYFLLASVIIFFDIKAISRVELGVLVLLFLILIFVFVKSFFQIDIDNIFLTPENLGVKNMFLPYGALLFSLWGVGLMPEVEEMLRARRVSSGSVENHKSKLSKIVVFSVLMVAVFYFLFMVFVLGIAGKSVDQTALTSLSNILGGGLSQIILFMGAVVTFTAFIAQGIIFKKILMYDLKIKSWQAFVITCFTPFVLFLLGFNSFVPIISLIGGVFLGITGFLILLMYKKIKGSKFIIYPLSIVFLLGIIYEIIFFIK